MARLSLTLAYLAAISSYAISQQCGGTGWAGSTTCGGWGTECIYINEARSECRVSLYHQCGGQGWSGSTVCVPTAKCFYFNPFYSCCEPLDFETASAPLATPVSD